MTRNRRERDEPILWSYVDTAGLAAFDGSYVSAHDFLGGLAWVRFPNGYGCIGMDGAAAWPQRFPESSAYFDNLAVMRRERCYGYLNPSGQWAIKPTYAQAEPFQEGIGIVREGRMLVLLDRHGRLIAKVAGRLADSYSCGLASILRGRDVFYIDRAGEIALGPYVAGESFSEDLALVEDRGRGCFINTQGEVQFDVACDYTSLYCQDGRICFREGGKYGYLDRRGEVVVPARYDAASDFEDGVAIVKFGDRTGFIDVHGRELSMGRFAWLEMMCFGEGLAGFSYDGVRFGYMDVSGRVIISPRFRRVRRFRNGRAIVCV